MRYSIILLFTIALFTTFSCKKDDYTDVERNDDLIKLLEQASPSGIVDYFLLPDEDDFERIPQDPKNV